MTSMTTRLTHTAGAVYTLSRLIERHALQDGVHDTAIPRLFLIRESAVTERIARVSESSFCLIVQGQKEVLLGEERFRYGTGDYIVTSMELPLTGQVTEATDDVPYLAIKFEFSPGEVLDLLTERDLLPPRRTQPKRALFVGQSEPMLADAMFRLASLLDRPQHISTLAPLYKKEALYWLLHGPSGEALRQLALEAGSAKRVRQVIDHILVRYADPFRIQELAELAHMSVSSLHRQFKEVTAMSPIQFQKQLRLQEARRLLLSESADVAEIALRVGYESQSQFSREYSRLFGLSPRADIRRMREG
ncbi:MULTISPECIES: AraC family transcriptional regulator [Saccharibacillus]|uniref:AraC family transcriptional regulator n=1 Tax=Saccharibacillus TaxID=456492 RepID=UPI001F33D686|nr:AraC family transcriptional regulator [Saccharibacillus sp. WB 17]